MNEPAERVSAPPDNTSSATVPQAESLTTSVAIWLAVQLAALVVSAARVPLWARFAQPGEDLALAVMLATQICAAALLAPMVLGSWPRALCAIALAIVFMQLSAMLAAADRADVVLASTYVASWLLALALYVRATRYSDVARATVVIGASCLTIGASALSYAAQEFSAATPWRLTMVNVLVIRPAQLFSVRPWILVLLILILGGAVVMMRRRSSRRA
jgi:hypothetical protein